MQESHMSPRGDHGKKNIKNKEESIMNQMLCILDIVDSLVKALRCLFLPPSLISAYLHSTRDTYFGIVIATVLE